MAAASSVLSCVDLLYYIVLLSGSSQPLVALSKTSRSTRQCSLEVQQQLLGPDRFLSSYFPQLAGIRAMLATGKAVFSGISVFHYMMELRRVRYNLKLYIDVDLLAQALTVFEQMQFVATVSNGAPYRAGRVGEDPEEAPILHSLYFVHPELKVAVSVFVPRFSCFYGLLQQQNTVLLNGLSGTGFFSLYPHATLIRREGLALRCHWRYRAAPQATTLYGCAIYMEAVSGTHHRSLLTGPRFCGDTHTWVVGGERCDHKAALAGNGWSIAQRSFYDSDYVPPVWSHAFITSRLVTSSILARPLVATSLSKAFLVRMLTGLERAIENGVSRQHWDGEIVTMLKSFYEGQPHTVASANGDVIARGSMLLARRSGYY